MSCFRTSSVHLSFLLSALDSTETLPPLAVVAIPDYPVAAGEKISLYCSLPPTSGSVTWSWERQQNQTWKEVGGGTELTLTTPEESGEYRCCATRQSSHRCTSHTVYIVSVQATGRSPRAGNEDQDCSVQMNKNQEI